MDTISKVREFVYEHQLLEDDSEIIIGVSGGADSMALLDILIQLGYECIVAHCNFHLRGDESNRDSQFVKNYCQKHEIKFTSIDFDTFGYMEEHSISLEMAARDLRYKWFEETRIKYNADKIAIAHHRDDSIETVLINLIRGTGIKGLTGISASNGNIVRPLLCLSRSEIIEYLAENKIEFVTDSTNNENEYIRNKIRLDIIPLLQTINPSVTKTIQKTSENLSSVEKIYNQSISQSKQRIFSQDRINVDLLLKENEPKTVLFEILNPYGFNSDIVQDIFSAAKGISGKIFYSENYVLVKDRNYFILKEKVETNNTIYYIEEGTFNINYPLKLNIEVYENSPSSSIVKNKDIIYLDKNKLSFPLTIRKWQKGDKFVPFGMKGSKKISDYFSDNKFSIIDKKNVWLLCSDDKVVWIIGERTDERFRITSNTKTILKITYHQDYP